MLTDRFYPSSYPNNYPPKYKPPKSLINNNQIVSSTINRYGNLLVSNQHQQQLTIDTNLKEESSYRLIDYLTWTIYFSSAISVISLIAITPNYVIEAVAIKEGRIIIADEFVAEENQKQEEIDYESIRLTGAIRSAIVTVIVTIAMFLSSLLIVIGCHYKSYCLTFVPCVLLLLPLVVITLDIYWTYLAWFKTIALVINLVNCSLGYIFSCTIKQREYKSLTSM